MKPFPVFWFIMRRNESRRAYGSAQQSTWFLYFCIATYIYTNVLVYYIEDIHINFLGKSLSHYFYKIGLSFVPITVFYHIHVFYYLSKFSNQFLWISFNFFTFNNIGHLPLRLPPYTPNTTFFLKISILNKII